MQCRSMRTTQDTLLHSGLGLPGFVQSPSLTLSLCAGMKAGLPLPYRSQAKAVMPPQEELDAVPDGPCRSVLMRSRMLRSMCTTQETLPHSGLGLPGYVQITSPIRRYTDLLAHWQIKVIVP